jgi:EAL domain-containing protein (putative c-di-GMP-specific phosphodiesterase class I)
MVVQVASMFDLQVVAQGIEREDQRQALAALGCEFGQGYLLGRPLPLGSSAAPSISAANRGFSDESLPSLQ